MKIQRATENCHPVLAECIQRIQREIIDKHRIPMKIFETCRNQERHQMLLQRGKTKDLISRHLYKIENDPPLYCTAVDFVHYDEKWSWNLRDNTIQSWYILFGNLVLDLCPELEWGGQDRKSKNYCHFQVRYDILVENLEQVPCVTP